MIVRSIDQALNIFAQALSFNSHIGAQPSVAKLDMNHMINESKMWR